MNRILDWFLKYMISEKYVEKEDADICRFGLECLILKAIHYLSYIVIGFVMDALFSLFISACVMIPLRSKAGGYHAKTRIGCYIFSCSMVSLLCMMNKLALSKWINIIIFVVANIIIWTLTPIENENRRLEKVEVNVFRKQSIFISLVIDVLILLMLWRNIGIYIFLLNGLSMLSILLLLGKAKIMKNTLEDKSE